MSKTLNLETFNEILFEAIPEEKRAELLAVELESAYAMKIEAMEELVVRLNAGEDYKEQLREVNNIDRSCDTLAAMLKDAEA